MPKMIKVQVDGMELTLERTKSPHWNMNYLSNEKPKWMQYKYKLTKETFIALWNTSASVDEMSKKVWKLFNEVGRVTSSKWQPELRRRATQLRKGGHLLRPLPLHNRPATCIGDVQIIC